jgi:predicted nucleic-acid-binding protein
VKSLDTNVLARFFIDDPDDDEAERQRPEAIAALSERAFVGATVILEFEWVMRGFYRLPRAAVGRVLTALAGLEHLVLEDRGAVLSAIELHAQGFDFVDALHLARSGRASSFATFDRRLAQRARGRSDTLAVELLNA